MVDTGVRSGRAVAEAMERVSAAVAEALEFGASEEELQTLVYNMAKIDNGAQEAEFLQYDPEAVYDEVPSGLIDLPTAIIKYGVNPNTLRGWVARRHLTICGRLKGSATRGGFVLIREAELIARMALPRNKGGRPRKRPWKTRTN